MLSDLSWHQMQKMAAVGEESELKSRLKMCFNVLNEYCWLLDSYILDFFTENHIQKLPKSWSEHVRRIPLEEFYFLMNLSVKAQYIWPLSILSLRVLIRFLTLPREVTEFRQICIKRMEKPQFGQFLSNYDHLEHPKLRNLFFKNVKPKKQVEIFKIAKTTAETATRANVNYVIDVGSGLGHLSRMMAYGFHLKVCSIETQAQLTAQAQVMDCQFEKRASKHLNDSELQHHRPVYLNQTIRCDLTTSEFVQNLKAAFSLDDDGDIRFGIVGLHPCGDLAAVLLRLYIECPQAKFINLVGCCYHKLSMLGDDPVTGTGFPLAEFSSKTCTNLSYEARALACHAIESYGERLRARNCDHLKIHCYRATLESLIDKNWPRLRKHPLGNVKPLPELTFSTYCQSALKKLNVSIPEEDLRSEETSRMLSKWEEVVKFYSLRLMLAPLIETAILLDRKIYVLERGARCKIIAAFNPEISPRNQLLISEKVEYTVMPDLQGPQSSPKRAITRGSPNQNTPTLTVHLQDKKHMESTHGALIKLRKCHLCLSGSKTKLRREKTEDKSQCNEEEDDHTL